MSVEVTLRKKISHLEAELDFLKKAIVPWADDYESYTVTRLKNVLRNTHQRLSKHKKTVNKKDQKIFVLEERIRKMSVDVNCMKEFKLEELDKESFE